MNEAQVILDFLFPPHQQAACAVGPGMGCFHDPTSGTVPRATAALLFIAAANVRLVTAAPGDGQRRLPEVAFVEAQVLAAAATRAWPLHRNRTQRRLQKLLVVSISPGNRNSQRHAAAISEHRALHTELTAIGRVFAGFFPRPAVTSSSLRPPLAIATRSRSRRRISAGRLSRTAATRPVAPTPESNDARCWTSRTAAVRLSTGSRFAASNRYHRRRPVDSHAGDRPWGWDDTWATAAPAASTFSPAFSQTYHSNRNACTPPCYHQPADSFPDPTHEVSRGSVVGPILRRN